MCSATRSLFLLKMYDESHKKAALLALVMRQIEGPSCGVEAAALALLLATRAHLHLF